MIDQLFGSSFAPPAPNTAIAPQTLCPSTVPLVLLPVRLETRFFQLPNGATELRVRVFPDKIHIDSHEPALTTIERSLGTQYWQQDWAAASDTVARADAWRALADRAGAARAAWIARVLEPTNVRDRATAPAPIFPILPPVGTNGERAWRRAPQARLLPDRWIAVVHSAGQVALSVTGKDITPGLAVGPDPDPTLAPDALTEAAILAGDAMAIDRGMKWLIDFDTAEAAGMAMRIPIPATLAGIDSLVVFGVATSLGTTNTMSQLADLLDAHHYTDGLEFLRYGTPTNNTDDRRAGFSSEDPAHTRSFATVVTADPTSAPNASRVGTALGLDAARIAPTLGRVGQAGQDHDRDLRSMNTALWQVGWGYYLTNMIGAETGLTIGSVDWTRGYFVNYVRAGGPFPALRCGPQPYGILPVTCLGLWAPGAGEAVAPQESWLKDLLIRARDTLWRSAVSDVARIGLRQAPSDPDADLADVMRTDAVSHGYITRTVLGRHYLEHLFALSAQDFTGSAASQFAKAARMVDALGLPQEAVRHPHVGRTFLSELRRLITAPLVQPGEVSPWQMLQEPNYIAKLLRIRNVTELIDARPDPSATDHATSLLEALLRQALLREIANAAARIAAPSPANDLVMQLLRDLELIDVVGPPPINNTLQPPTNTLHWKRQLDSPVPGGSGKIGDALEQLTDFTPTNVSALGEFRESLTRLQGLDTESLQYLTQSTLDLSSHRLDAWITSFATKRLALMRRSAPAGQFVGAYGWVENLKPALPQPLVAAASLPPGEQAPMLAPAKDSGFIHAPSLTHASAAALLRNAHLGPTGIPSVNGPFAIDLSSQRVREASRLLDGVRQGQPLAALLGYRFERRLHELGLDRFITPIRNIAPLNVRARETNNLPAARIAANNVVDALVLMRRWQDDSDASLVGALAGATIDESGKITNELVALRDSIDALSDALTSEAAYQMARGNATRVATTLSAIAQGDAPPPELEVARIPRSGNAITHRVLVLFSGTSNAGGGWTNATARGTLEQWLGAWIRALLGDARKVRCTVEQLDSATGAVAGTATFPLSDVPISSLDFVYSVRPVGQSVQSKDPAPSVAEQLVLYHARRMTNGFGNDANLRLQHARPANLAAGETTLFDVLEQARAIRRLLERARGVRPEDVSPTERASQATIDLVELESRVVHYENALNAAHKNLTSLVAKGTATLAEDYRTWIQSLANFGIEPAVPCVAVGDTPETRVALSNQAAAMLKSSLVRMNQMTALRAQDVATDQRARCDQLLERGRAIYGADFVSLPNFTCDAAGAAELNAALAASTQQQGGDPLAVHGWFTRTARVRDKVGQLGACMRTADVLATGTRLNLSVAQLPFINTERWVGLTPIPGTELPLSKLSVAVQQLTAINATQPMSGLFVDEWVEIVPSKKETTALAFQFDPPNSFAPQNVLIAVPPVPGQDWTTETLRRVLVETLDLAKLRAVDTSLLGATAQYLPALYVPFNAADDAVSTDFLSLTA